MRHGAPTRPTHSLNKPLAKAQSALANKNYGQALEHLTVCRKRSTRDVHIEWMWAKCHAGLGREEDAIRLYTKVIEESPRFSPAYYELAYLLWKRDPKMALEVIDLGLLMLPNEWGLLHYKAKLLVAQGILGTALKVFDDIEKNHQPDLPCEMDHANTLRKANQYQLALKKYASICERHPDHLDAALMYGKSLYESRHLDKALEVFLGLLEKTPDDSHLLFLIGACYGLKSDRLNGTKYYKKSFELNPSQPCLAGTYLYCASFICDWRDYEAIRAVLDSDHERIYSSPFPSVTQDNDPKANQAYASNEIRRVVLNTGILGPLRKYERHEKIRIGYYSADFFNHATVMLIEGMLKSHDRNTFELHAFELTPVPADESNARIRNLFDRYHDVSSISDNAIAYMSRELEIDIAIDLKGFTLGNRVGIFAERAAPIQINYLGFPGSMGVDFMDYMVADHYTIPPEIRPYFSERIIYMPHCYQPNNPWRPKPNPDAARPSELPPDAFVYCSFNNIYKLTPAMFNTWASILKQTPSSVLWLLRTTAEAETHLRQEAALRGIDPERLIFAPIVSEAEHLQRVSFADCFLDSFPCNAHTTASDAVWAGVPIVTRSGQTFASRVAGSILTTVGLPDLIVENDSDYERLAVKIYQNPAYLQSLKARLAQGIEAGPLYDARQYTKNFERALTQVYEQLHKNEAPRDWVL